MARSTYIYLVLESNSFKVQPVAAFTVKREMLTWLGHQDKDRLHVYRMTDNPDGFGKPITDITLEVMDNV